MSAERIIRVMVVDHHPIFLDGARSLVESAQDLTLVGTAESAVEALNMAPEAAPDVIVLSTSLPDMNGFRTAQQLASNNPPRSVVLLSEIEDSPYVKRAFEAGIKAYVLKRSPGTRLLHAIRTAVSNGVYIDPAITAQLLTSPTPGSPNGNFRLAWDARALTLREAEVIRLVACGYSTKEIGAQLHVSSKSIETYKVRACEKLELRTRAQIVRFAAANGWLSFESLPPSIPRRTEAAGPRGPALGL
jgi:DNA-binding NarL/FixJ family response regulator